MRLLEGQVAVITGGAGGIGFAIAQAYVDAGARVVIGDRDRYAAQQAVERLHGLSAPDEGRADPAGRDAAAVAVAVECDVIRSGDMEALVSTARDVFGGLDVWVNNAGITRDATLRTMTEEQFDEVVAVHLKGCWLGTRAAVAVMREQRHGAIVNLSSLSGKVGMAGQTNYAAAKAGIVGLTKSAAKEVARFGVRVNAIAPGLIRTSMVESIPPQVWQERLQQIPLLRAGEPHEVASVALFLASDMASYLTGAVLEVTGGRFM
ncbi:MAG: 3-oxoacyl-ACP reductase FabG [Austwickia sp.]|jgi:3-oxoacyl-[acyl-carrier protein] reductase|nr:3-oxoacyl-ACP reductase FabG [Austwickia sp.]MBK8437822.1 3-oxoacyl-ACP reductase FabG [Austwickia sp.]MBK9100129.1 3-oxoacyl-ACP reductase FabG [Austwickia sp.]